MPPRKDPPPDKPEALSRGSGEAEPQGVERIEGKPLEWIPCLTEIDPLQRINYA